MRLSIFRAVCTGLWSRRLLGLEDPLITIRQSAELDSESNPEMASLARLSSNLSAGSSWLFASENPGGRYGWASSGYEEDTRCPLNSVSDLQRHQFRVCVDNYQKGKTAYLHPNHPP